MPYPAGLHVVEHPFPSDPPSNPDARVVVLVHGVLDRANSFRQTIRRLPADLRIIAYDRRGYQSSRAAGPSTSFDEHVADLIAIMNSALRERQKAVVVGHSMGGLITLSAVVERPDLFEAAGVYEPPVPWLRTLLAAPTGSDVDQIATPVSSLSIFEDPAAMDDVPQLVERFIRYQAGDEAWDRLPDAARADRLADAPALLSDIELSRSVEPLPFADIHIPVLVGVGGQHGPKSAARAAFDWLADSIEKSEGFVIEAAGHGAHLTHPEAFAEFVRRTIDSAN